MLDLDFEVTGLEAVSRGLTPLLQFKTRITTSRPVQAMLLTAQIQIMAPQRAYSPAEKEKLLELFGTPDRWGQTLRNQLWTISNATVGAFETATETSLPVPCTFDLNVAATKYFHALDGGDVPLQFLFSGSTFYAGENGGLQVSRISWNKECTYRMPTQAWKDLMEEHFPNSAWLYLRRDVFDKLWEYRRRQGLATWEQTLEQLLQATEATA